MINWIRNLWKSEPKPLPKPEPVSEPLPDGKLTLVPCGCCKRPLFYYTHTIPCVMSLVYQHVLNLKGEKVNPPEGEFLVRYKDVNPDKCCRYPMLPNIQDCVIVDNPFIKKKRKRRSSNATTKKDSK